MSTKNSSNAPYCSYPRDNISLFPTYNKRNQKDTDILITRCLINAKSLEWKMG